MSEIDFNLNINDKPMDVLPTEDVIIVGTVAASGATSGAPTDGQTVHNLDNYKIPLKTKSATDYQEEEIQQMRKACEEWDSLFSSKISVPPPKQTHRGSRAGQDRDRIWRGGAQHHTRGGGYSGHHSSRGGAQHHTRGGGYSGHHSSRGGAQHHTRGGGYSGHHSSRGGAQHHTRGCGYSGRHSSHGGPYGEQHPNVYIDRRVININ